MSEIKEIKGEISGKCPKCNSGNLNYGDSGEEGESYYYEFTCDDCGAEGKEWYFMEYVESIVNVDD